MVFLEVELNENIAVPPNQLDSRDLPLQKAIMLRLLDEFARRKASKEHGYYITVTTLNSVPEEQVHQHSSETIHPVSFSCTTLKPCKGEILVGVIDKVMKHGIFLKSGPIQSIFLTTKMMDGYKYSMAEEPMYVNEDQQLKMGKGSKVRFRVSVIRWIEWDKEFHLMAALAGDFLGPV